MEALNLKPRGLKTPPALSWQAARSRPKVAAMMEMGEEVGPWQLIPKQIQAVYSLRSIARDHLAKPNYQRVFSFA
jgi:hypothetical protein